MKFLVTGSAGLVGSQVIRDLSGSHIVFSCYSNFQPESGTAIHLDLTNTKDILTVIEDTKPDVIVHLAAMTNVDQCEIEKDVALQINAKSTATLAKQATKYGAFLVYVSTDYVFDGEEGMKKESDVPNPIGYYGRSKLEGELAVQNLSSNWCIARTSTPYGFHPKRKSFPLFVAENLVAQKVISVITDQYTSPTYVQNLSKMLIEIASRKIQGIFHLAGSTRISRYDMALMVAEKLGLDKSLLKPAKMEDMNWKAKRPKDSSLDVSQASSILKEKPMSVQQGLDLFIEQMKQKPN
jgi:dTDP-4-dehydrorhamnose reductase